jgi:hypothetical protein
VVFGVFASIAIYTSQVWIALGLAFCFVAAFASLVLRGQLGITLSADSIEGLTIVGRARIRYADVDRIQELSFPHVTIVVSSLGTIWIPSGLKDYDQLLDVLWDRVVRPIGADPPSFQRDRRLLARSTRRSEQIGGTRSSPCRAIAVARPPFWMLVFARSHPLRRQYRWHRHLLMQGHVALGLIVDADAELDLPLRSDHVLDGSALILFGPDLRFEEAPALLEEIADRIWRSGRHEEDHVVDAIESFNQRFDEEGPFPLQVEVPDALTRGHRVLCSTS